MGPIERLRRRLSAVIVPEGSVRTELPALAGEVEEPLRETLRENPNDVEAFARLAEVVRRRAAEGHVADDPQRAADDAVWALAEELAHSGKAWYPLVEMARLSIENDREAAMRRLGTAAERDPSGHALALGLQMLRQTGHPGDALNLGVGHWRPHDHDPEVGRQLVEAAVEAGRYSDARRHLRAVSGHPDRGVVERLGQQLERLIAEAEQGKTHPKGATKPFVKSIDLREPKPRRSGGFGRR